MDTFVRDICLRHSAAFAPYDGDDELPSGWRELMFELGSDLARVLGPNPPHRIVLKRVREKLGVLRISHDLSPRAVSGEPMAIVVAAMVASAERRSVAECDRCGNAAVLRRTTEGRYLTRCKLHAEGAVPVPGGRAGLFPFPFRIDDAVAVPHGGGGYTHQLCRAFPDQIIDHTGVDEIPPGWQVVCGDLLWDVAMLMAAAPLRKLRLRRIHAEGQELRWDAHVPLDAPTIVRAAIRLAFLRASREAKSVCRICGSRDGVASIMSAGCACDKAKGSRRRADRSQALVVSLDEAQSMEKRVFLAFRRASRRRPPILAGIDMNPPTDAMRFPLYRRTDVANALGLIASGPEGPDLLIAGEADDTHQQARIKRILDQGEIGRWRTLARPTREIIATVEALAASAPHLAEFVAHVVRHLRAAHAIGLPTAVPPCLLLGPPGVGKTWLLTKMSTILGVPHRVHPMNLATTADAISGAHGVWRNAGPGLVAKTLLAERHANPIILVDEFDKGHLHNGADAFGPFFTLFEPVGARTFVDEYLGFPMDASRIIWVASGNEVAPIPEPIRDRLTIFEVPMPSAGHLAAVVDSIYADANAARRTFFEPSLDPALRDALTRHPPRSIRIMIEDAMVRAAAAGRRCLAEGDLIERTLPGHPRFGFVQM